LLTVEALGLPLVRLLLDRAGRLLHSSEGDGSAAPSILRRSLLAYSAGLLAIGTGVAAGLIPGASALHIAGGRSKVNLSDAASGSTRQPQLTGGERRGAPPGSVGVAAVALPSPAVAVPDPIAPPSATASLPPPTYVNPLARVGNLQPKRIDEGVDYAGAGPLVAMGSGTIRVTTESGWPGNTFIALQLDKGQLAGGMIYYAENITPTVSVGQHVNAGDVVGVLHEGYPNLEIGWAGGGLFGGTLGDALARSLGGDAEGVSTAVGVNFNQYLVMLGAPGGIQQGLMGRLPAA
jgi:hypothetical protein